MNTSLRELASRRADLLSGIAVILLWDLIAEIFAPRWLPTIPSVLKELVDLIEGGALSALGTTLSGFALGMVITFVVSGLLALVMASNATAEQTLLPFVSGFLTVPHIALIPIFTFVWGNGDEARIATTVSFAVSAVALTWATALKQRPAHLIEMAVSFEASKVDCLRYIRLPVASAPLIAGVRIAVVQGIKGIVSAEVIIGVAGIGKLITTASQTFNIAELYAVVMIIIGMSVLCYVLLTKWESRATRWNA